LEKIRHIKYYLAASVSLITFIIYLPTLRNEFVMWDDSRYIFENSHIRSFDMALFKWAFCDFYAGNWHPLTWISHALDYVVWGLNPLGHHLSNNILHAINTFLVVFLIMKLLETAKERTTQAGLLEFLTERTILITGGVTGLLFGLHPLHVESVAWVSERKDLLCALFFIFSIIQYTNYVRNKDNETASKKSSFLSDKYYLFTLAFFILALLSKPMAVTLPVVLLILDWYPFNRITSSGTFRTALIEKLPFVALSLILSILTTLAHKAGGAVVSMEKASLSTRALVAAKSLTMYLWKMIWPLNLVPYYPYPKDVSLLSFQYLSAIVIVAVITAGCVVLVKKQKVWLTAWGYYVLILIPVIGIVQVGSQSMADRYMYLPSLGPFLIMGLGAAWIWKNEVNSILLKLSSIIIASVLIISVSYVTFTQIGLWKNSIALWSYVIGKYPKSVYIAYINRGLAYEKMGRQNKALEDYNEAVAMSPSYIYAYNNRGWALGKMGQLDKAIEDFDKSIELEPSNYNAYNGRGMMYEKKGEVNKAIEDYNKAITVNPSSPVTYFNLGILYGKTGSYDKAIKYFDKSIALNPKNADYYSNRGVTYYLSGQFGRALEDFSKAIALDPNIATVYYSRGVTYLNTGRKELAIADFRKACDLGEKDGCKGLRLLSQGP
jgi:tetratricopeptide (TPR) repeat protein